MRRSVLLAVVCVAALAGGSAQANHKKPITGAYSVVVPVSTLCMGATTPVSDDLHDVTLPEPGRLVVDLVGQGVDMELYLLNSTGGTVASSTAFAPVEKVSYKVKKPGKYTIRVCNYLLAPIGDVKFVFTFDK